MTAPWSAVGDWGTSRMRLFRMTDGRVVDRVEGPGIGNLPASAADALWAALASWAQHGKPTSITLCGMAGSRGGLFEVPYADCPVDVAGWRAQRVARDFDGVPLMIAPGVACVRRNGAPDVMRGEETQIFGAMALHPDLGRGSHVLALPGTHSKWAEVHDGRIMSFATMFTGELFALLRDRSTLCAATEATDEDGFEAGLARAREPGPVTAHLFEARSAQLRQRRSPAWAAEFLSGLLIGSEVAAFAESPVLIGDPLLTARYARALAAFGRAPVTMLDGDACVLAGLETIE